MAAQSLLYKSECRVNDAISVMIPTVGEILENESTYYELVSLIVSTPYDMMVQLDDMGIDFTQINDYELFLLLFDVLRARDTRLLFGELPLHNFEKTVNPQNGMTILRDSVSGARIDQSIYTMICAAVRKIHHLKRSSKKPANEAAQKYMIQRAREKMRRAKKGADESYLEELIVAMVNTEQFPYNFETVKDLTIYQFNESVQQVSKKIEFDNTMHGVYAGTISAKDIPQDDLNWLTHRERT